MIINKDTIHHNMIGAWSYKYSRGPAAQRSVFSGVITTNLQIICNPMGEAISILWQPRNSGPCFEWKLKGGKILRTCTKLFSVASKSHYCQHRTWILTFEIELESEKILWMCPKLFSVAPTNHYSQNRTWILTFGIELESGKILWTCTKLFSVAPTSHYSQHRTWILTFGIELESGKILWTCTKLFLVAPTSHYTQFRGQLNKPFNEPTYLYTNLRSNIQ